MPIIFTHNIFINIYIISTLRGRIRYDMLVIFTLFCLRAHTHLYFNVLTDDAHVFCRPILYTRIIHRTKDRMSKLLLGNIIHDRTHGARVYCTQITDV